MKVKSLRHKALFFLFILFSFSSFSQEANNLRYFMQGNAKASSVPYGNNAAAGAYLRSDDAKIYYEIYGKGSPIVVLHGGIVGSPLELGQLIDSLSQKHQVISIATRGHGIRKFFYEIFSRNFGIISLTTEPVNILMWSHYSSETGFLIELETKCLKGNLRKNNRDIRNYCFRPVQYVDELESIDAFQEGFTTPDVSFLYMTNFKRKEWSYEEEWRLAIYKQDMGIPLKFMVPGAVDYVGKEDRKVYYAKECVKSLVIGKHFFNGKNCDQLNDDKSFVITNSEFLKLVNYLFENHNNKLFMSGELQRGSKFGRSVSKIEIKKLADDTFIINDLKEVYSKLL